MHDPIRREMQKKFLIRIEFAETWPDQNSLKKPLEFPTVGSVSVIADKVRIVKLKKINS